MSILLNNSDENCIDIEAFKARDYITDKLIRMISEVAVEEIVLTQQSWDEWFGWMRSKITPQIIGPFGTVKISPPRKEQKKDWDVT